MRLTMSILGLLVYILCIIAILIISLMHPDMTQTRLFLTFWKQYLLIIVFIGISTLLIYGGRR